MNKLSSACVGGLIALMILFNGTLANAVGNYQSSVIIHLIGLLGLGLILWVRKSKIKFSKAVPWYAYTAGLIGVVPILCNNIGFNVLGISLTLALGLFGQSLSSIVIDHYGFFGMTVVKFNNKKWLGLGLIVAGIVIMTVF